MSDVVELGDWVNFWDKTRGERLGTVVGWVAGDPKTAMVREHNKARSRRVPVAGLTRANVDRPAPAEEKAETTSVDPPAPAAETGEIVGMDLAGQGPDYTGRSLIPLPVQAEVMQPHQLRALDVRPEMIFSPEEAKQKLEALKTFVHDVMVPGTDYGEPYPGAKDEKGEPKKTLLKPGAEKLLEIYGYYPETTIEQAIEDWTGESVGTPGMPFFFYRVRVDILSKKTGLKVGEGVGSCNSWEKKYRWRTAERKCPGCGLANIRESKKSQIPEFYCWKKTGGCGAKFAINDPAITGQELGQVPNPDIADQANTILKMSKKRGHVDGTIGATRSSDLFTQDLEDLPGEAEPPPSQEPAPKGGGGGQPAAGTPESPPHPGMPPDQQPPKATAPSASSPVASDTKTAHGAGGGPGGEQTTIESTPDAAKPTTDQYKRLNPLIKFFSLQWEKSGEEVRVTFPDYALLGMADHAQVFLVYAGDAGEPEVSRTVLEKILVNLKAKQYRIDQGQEVHPRHGGTPDE